MHKFIFLIRPWFACGFLTLAACNTTASKIPFSKENYRVKNESVLYVFRERAFVGSGMKTVLFFDGKSVGILPQNGYYPIHTLAGRHKLRGCSASFVAPEECEEIDVDTVPQDFMVWQLAMTLTAAGPRTSFVKAGDLAAFANIMNEGNYYDSSLRELLPQSEKRLTLSAATLGQDKAEPGGGPLKIAILNFSDHTNSNLYGWLAGSLPDAIDQSMRKDFEYRRPNPVATQKTADKSPSAAPKQLAHDLAANLIISGHYSLNPGGASVHIEAQIYFADTDTVLATEGIEAPVDAQIFNATQALAEKLVFRLHQFARK